MTRYTVKEIIAFSFYKRREEIHSEGIEPYGNEHTDQECAERVIKFFEGLKDGSVSMGDWQNEKLYEDYKMYEGLCQEIVHEESPA